MRKPSRRGIVGRSEPRRDGAAKVSGRARYVDDLVFPGMLFGRTIRSATPRGIVEHVHIARAPRDLVVVDHRSIPGENVIAAIADDQPCLVARAIEHVAEPIVLLAHQDREALYAVEVEVDVTPRAPVFDPEVSTHAFQRIEIAKGDAAVAMRSADLVVEGEYRTGLQEQLYIEPNGMIAWPEDGGITVVGSLQCPYYVHTALVRLLALPAEKVRVIQAETGGGFGGKEEFPSIVAAHAALLALAAKRPVKLVYDRHEDLLASTKRHPSIVRHRTGVGRDGTIVAMEIEVLLDGGAYTTLSPVVLSRGCIHATGAYRCANVRIRGRAMKTNTPPNGAFRGFGAPQTIFAIEAHLDRIAEALGIDPLRLREKNALRAGDTTATGQRMERDTSALAVMREAVRRSGYRAKRRAWGIGRDDSRGIGLSLFFHGSGFTGSGESKLASRASLELTVDGVRVHVGSSEIGQGTRTMLAQIVAETLGWPMSRVDVVDVDTSMVPDSGPTVASRTCLVVGTLLERCAKALRAALRGRSAREFLAARDPKLGPYVVTEHYRKPPDVEWDDATYRGSAYAAYAFGCNVAEVRIDRATGEVRPDRLTAVVDVGRAVNPVLVRGQIEGGSAQGVGFALFEAVVMEDGRMKNAQLTNYIVPTTLDTPRFDVVIVEKPSRHGPYGAKGVGEAPIDGPAPAIVNALRHAGLDIRAIPALPESVLDAIEARDAVRAPESEGSCTSK